MDLKYDRVYACVELDRIRENLKNIKALLEPGTKVLAVLKADAYGHGARVVANYISDEIDMAGVAGVSEGLELRRAMDGGRYYSPAFTKPILVLGYTHPSMFRAAAEHDISLTVFDAKNAAELDKEAAAIGRIATVHIAVDTGMRRIGFRPCKKSIEDIKKISKLKNVKIGGIFSHFARADEKAGAESVAEQGRIFAEFCDALEAEGVDTGVRHISNSAAIMSRNNNYKLVRAGIVLYGHYPSPETDRDVLPLKPALSVRTRVINVANLNKGEGISYGHTFVADRRYRVATIAAGYADGIFRTLSGKGCVLIRGVRCAILGRICMDQMMVDVSNVPGCAVGDEAVIFGESCGEVLSCEEVAETAGSFNYELLCEIGRRITRIYFINGEAVETVSYL
jgi:alanine racemase